MYENDTIEQVSEYLRLVLRFTGQYRIPINPVNYAVWYEYVSGVNPELARAIDVHLKEARPFTPEVNQGLFVRYVAERRGGASEKAFLELQRILKEILSYLAGIGDDVSGKTGTFEQYLGQLQSGEIGMEDLQKVIDGVIDGTKSVIESSSAIKDRLDSTTKEVDSLKEELESTQQQARTDALTGLANRREFDTMLPQMIKEAQESESSLCALMADIDHFKQINDVHGHLVGDQVLRLAAAIIKNNIKGKDFAARYGGEEFVILLPDTPLAGARVVAEQLRGYLETKKWKKKGSGSTIGTVTISIGVVHYTAGEPPEDFIQRADKALYASKEGGRNRVTVMEKD